MKPVHQTQSLNSASTDSESPTHTYSNPQSHPAQNQEQIPSNPNNEMAESIDFLQMTKKMNATIKTLQDTVGSVEAMVRKKSIKINNTKFSQGDLPPPKSTSNEQVIAEKKESNVQHAPSITHAEIEKPSKKVDSEIKKETTEPSIWSKVEKPHIPNISQIKNSHKSGNSDAKKLQESPQDSPVQVKNMKKNGISYYNEPHPTSIKSMSPVKPEKEVSSPKQAKVGIKNNFKSLNQIWAHKLSGEKVRNESDEMMKKSQIINGFEIGRQLGRGKFSEVFIARHADTGAIVALKKITKNAIKQYKMIEQFKAEIRLHSSLDHPNIVKFYGFFEEGDFIYLILEYMNGGTLFEYISEKEMLGVGEAVQYLKDVIEGLTYMHDRSIAHRDIKPENIVLTSEKVAKLCDFGWSAVVQSSRKTYCGTFDYAPPEILQHKKYDESVDIWCIGVLTFEILTGHVPFEGDKRMEIMEKILSVDKNRIQYPVEIPDDAKNFIEILVQKDPELRPKSRQLLKHPFFVNNLKPSKGKRT